MHPAMKAIAPITLSTIALFACQAGNSDHATASSSDALQAQPCGTELAEVDGIHAYSNGWAEATGESCDGSSPNGALRWQCVEFAQRYMHAIYSIQEVWPVEYAAQMCDHHPNGTTAHRNGDGYVPQRGDLAVWQTHTYGHVAVVAAVHGSDVDIVEQNGGWSVTGSRTIDVSNPACWVSAEENQGANDPPSQSAPPGPGAGGCAGYSDGLYCGTNYVGDDPGTLYRCTGGALAVQETCALGCEWRPDGQDDRCRTEATCRSGAGKYCGGDGISGAPDVLFDCQEGLITPLERCAGSCAWQNAGVDDYCR